MVTASIQTQRPPILATGQVLDDRYRIVGILAEGGMGTVFLAEHVPIGRRIAIKVLHRELAHDTSMVKRFMNEAPDDEDEIELPRSGGTLWAVLAVLVGLGGAGLYLEADAEQIATLLTWSYACFGIAGLCLLGSIAARARRRRVVFEEL